MRLACSNLNQAGQARLYGGVRLEMGVPTIVKMRLLIHHNLRIVQPKPPGHATDRQVVHREFTAQAHCQNSHIKPESH